MSLSPFIRTPLTDITSCVANHQQYDKCGKREILMLECLEAYGMDMGQKKCNNLIEDFQECVGMRKQLARVEAMQAERERQFKAGLIAQQYAPPPRFDAY